MSVPASHIDWYLSGPYSAYQRGHRIAGGAAQMLEVAQPPGDFSDPPNDDLVLIQALSHGIRQRSNLGGGFFEGASAAGDLFLVPPQTATNVVAHNDHAIRMLVIPSEVCRSQLEESTPGRDPFDFGRLHAGSFKNAHVLNLMERIWAEAELGDLISRLLCESAVITLVMELRRAADPQCDLERFRGGLAPWQERRCTEYLRDNAAEDVDLATLAAVANLSPFHFARMFKRTTGVPPHRYQLLIRLECAKQMLVETDMSVLEIALAVGYDAPQTLARLFRREMGTTPSAYRRERRA